MSSYIILILELVIILNNLTLLKGSMSKIYKFLFTILFFVVFLLAEENTTTETEVDSFIKFPIVSIHAEDTHLPSILAILAKESGFNIVTGPNVQSQNKLTIHLDDVPIDQAINLVIRAAGLSYEIVGNSFLIAEPNKLGKEVGITSHVIDLQYSDAQEVKVLLQDLTKQIQVDVSGNKLLINASPKKIAEIENVIKKIDVPARQILLERR